jgi:hypothetical protein
VNMWTHLPGMQLFHGKFNAAGTFFFHDITVVISQGVSDRSELILIVVLFVFYQGGITSLFH